MSETKFSEFRERAEHGIALPDLAALERQGRALRRTRVTVSVAGLALALLAGAGVTKLASDGPDAAPAPLGPPSPAPSPSPSVLWNSGVNTKVDYGEDVLLPGPSQVRYDGIVVRFDVPGENWEWWEAGMGLRRSAHAPQSYGGAVFFLRNALARLAPCHSDRVRTLGADPDRLVANVAPLLHLAHSTVLDEPRVVHAFGGTAVHLRLQTEGECPFTSTALSQLEGFANGFDYTPGWPDKHELDLWHVVVPGREPSSMLVASWDLGGSQQQRAQQQALLESVRISAGGRP